MHGTNNPIRKSMKKPEWCCKPLLARQYISGLGIFDTKDIDIKNMSDERILEFANDVYSQYELVISKYILKQISKLML